MNLYGDVISFNNTMMLFDERMKCEWFWTNIFDELTDLQYKSYELKDVTLYLHQIEPFKKYVEVKKRCRKAIKTATIDELKELSEKLINENIENIPVYVNCKDIEKYREKLLAWITSIKGNFLYKLRRCIEIYVKIRNGEKIHYKITIMHPYII